MRCEECQGDGWTVEPDHGPECYARGECVGGADCPVAVQVECPACGGRGEQ